MKFTNLQDQKVRLLFILQNFCRPGNRYCQIHLHKQTTITPHVDLSFHYHFNIFTLRQHEVTYR